MCGIVFLDGPNANQRLVNCLDRINHRGPDETYTWKRSEKALGFTRLAINGEGAIGSQPYIDGDWVGVVNGEIYNYKKLAIKYELPISFENDTQVLLPLYKKLDASVINALDGFYAALLYNHKNHELILMRDCMGKKPLFYGCTESEFFIASELKAIDSISWFKPVPKGLTRFNLNDRRVTEVVDCKDPNNINQDNVGTILHEAVEKRLPKISQPVGIFLSGGLDSSIIAAIASRLRSDITYFTLGNEDSEDSLMVKELVKFLGLKDVRFISLPTGDLLEQYIEEVVRVTESFNPSIISNGLATYILAQAARVEGIKVVMTGEGADELFGGYFNYLDPDELSTRRNQLISDMHYTELRRLDLCTMAHSVEARCPFLDKSAINLSNCLPFTDVYSSGINKVILRKYYQTQLPKSIITRPKVSFDVGSGIRKSVVRFLTRNGRSEREELQKLWFKYYGNRIMDEYFYRYPAFDSAIDRRGEVHR